MPLSAEHLTIHLFADRVHVSDHWILVQALANTLVPELCHRLCTVTFLISGL